MKAAYPFALLPILFLSTGCFSFSITGLASEKNLGGLEPIEYFRLNLEEEKGEISKVDLANVKTEGNYLEKVFGFREKYYCIADRIYLRPKGGVESDWRKAHGGENLPFWENHQTITGSILTPKQGVPGADWIFVIPGKKFTESSPDSTGSCMAENLAEMNFPVVRIDANFDAIPQGSQQLAANRTGQQALDAFGDSFMTQIRCRVIALKRMMDWIQQKYPTAEPIRFHVIGVSLGGILGSLVAADDPIRVKTLMMIISSGRLSKIVMNEVAFSLIPSLEAIKDVMLDKFVSRSEAILAMDKKMRPVDPITYAHRLNPARIVMVSAGWDMVGCILDSVMPLSATLETWWKFGCPDWIIMPFAGHGTSLVALWPIWLEITRPHHSLLGWIRWEPHYMQIVRAHFLPKVLKSKI